LVLIGGNHTISGVTSIMCNLYSIITDQAAIAALFRRMNRYVGNLPPMRGVFPDHLAPVIRNAGDAEEMVLMRWGMPPPRTGTPPVTNIHNMNSPHWRGCLDPANPPPPGQHPSFNTRR
jgi:putative SOS response-associated peptidase YedK